MNPEKARLLPILIFGIFALFWTAYDIAMGLWWAIIPSALVTAALVTKALLSSKGEPS